MEAKGVRHTRNIKLKSAGNESMILRWRLWCNGSQKVLLFLFSRDQFSFLFFLVVNRNFLRFFFCEDQNCLFRVKFCVYYFLRYFDALIRSLIFEISFRGFEIGQKARRIKWKLRYLARFCRDRSLPRIAPRSPIWKWKERDIVRSVGLAGERMIFKRNLSRRFYKTFVKIFDENYLKFISNTF